MVGCIQWNRHVVRTITGLLAVGALSIEAAGAGGRTQIDAPRDAVPVIREALRLLPRSPTHVRVVREDQISPEFQLRFRSAEAFVSKGHPVVFVTSHSPTLRAAVDGSAAHVYALATIIWHEMAHLDGADEAEAQRQEELLWTRFLLGDHIDRTAGLRYLNRLHERRVALIARSSP
jgi:hypothetical protein